MGRRRKRSKSQTVAPTASPDPRCGACKGTGFVPEPVAQVRQRPDGGRIEYRPALARCACWNRMEVPPEAKTPEVDRVSQAAGERKERSEA